MSTTELQAIVARPFTPNATSQLRRALKANLLMDTDDGDMNAMAILQELGKFHTGFDSEAHFLAFAEDYRVDYRNEHQL